MDIKRIGTSSRLGSKYFVMWKVDGKKNKYIEYFVSRKRFMKAIRDFPEIKHNFLRNEFYNKYDQSLM